LFFAGLIFVLMCAVLAFIAGLCQAP
jgi:hypothetical protein